MRIDYSELQSHLDRAKRARPLGVLVTWSDFSAHFRRHGAELLGYHLALACGIGTVELEVLLRRYCSARKLRAWKRAALREIAAKGPLASTWALKVTNWRK